MHRCAPGLCPWPTSLRSLYITCRQCHKSWPVRYQQYCILSSVRWWHSAVYRYTNMSTLAHQVVAIESCTQRVHNWLLNNSLHLNPSKSNAIAFFNPRSKPIESLAKPITSISVAGPPIKLQSSIKNLGVYLDSKMSFDKQVSETCKVSYFHIRALRHIWSSLTTEACKTIAAAIVGSPIPAGLL